MADTSYSPTLESRDCLKPVGCHRIRIHFSNMNNRNRPRLCDNSVFAISYPSRQPRKPCLEALSGSISVGAIWP